MFLQSNSSVVFWLLGKNLKTSCLRNPVRPNQPKLTYPCFINCNTLRWSRAWQGRQKTGEHMQNPGPCVPPLGAHLNTL